MSTKPYCDGDGVNIHPRIMAQNEYQCWTFTFTNLHWDTQPNNTAFSGCPSWAELSLQHVWLGHQPLFEEPFVSVIWLEEGLQTRWSDLRKAFPRCPRISWSASVFSRCFSKLFDPHAEEHQEDTFCFPHPVALTVWLIVHHTVYLESLETPGQPEPDHGAVPLLCSGNQFQCTDGKNWETQPESLRPSCLCADWPTCEQRHFYWCPQNSYLYLNWKNTDVLKADRRSVAV